MLNFFARHFFKWAGWKVTGVFPYNIPKAVMTVCPHTDWRDFFLGLGTRATLRLHIGFLGKEELFKPPFGFIFKWLGGTPVKRDKRTNLVANQVAAVNSVENCLFSLAPEGTRKNVEKLKTGFYYMAVQAKIPIIMVGFDYPRKQVIFAPAFTPSGDFQADMLTYFVPFFSSIQGVQKDWIRKYQAGEF